MARYPIPLHPSRRVNAPPRTLTTIEVTATHVMLDDFIVTRNWRSKTEEPEFLATIHLGLHSAQWTTRPESALLFRRAEAESWADLLEPHIKGLTVQHRAIIALGMGGNYIRPIGEDDDNAS